MQRTGALALLAVGLSSCGLFTSDRSAANPLDFISKDAAAVVELRDIGMLVQLRLQLSEQFKAVVSPTQVAAFQEELKRSLGFDPTTLKGLAGVGLATTGPVAGHVLEDGTGAVWAAPVTNAKTLAGVIATLMKTRAGIEAPRTETRDGVALTIYETEFGKSKVVTAAHAEARGHIVLGVGPKAADLVVSAVKLEKTNSVQTNLEYRSLSKSLADAFDVRMVSPNGRAALQAALDRLGRDSKAFAPMLKHVSAAGWTVRYRPGAVVFRGRTRLDDAGKKLTAGIFKTTGGAPAGVRSVNLDRAVLLAQVAGDPKALLDVLAPAGSAPRADFDQAVEVVKRDLDIDVMGEVIPNLSGHAALALGTGDLGQVEFKELVGNPWGQLWTAFAASAKNTKALADVENKLEERLKERRIEIRTRKVGPSTLREFVPQLPDGKKADPLFSTFTHKNAWGFSTEPVVGDALLKNAAGADALNGEPGVFVELRMARLNTELRRFKVRELPVVYRAVVMKILDYVSLFDTIGVRVDTVDDGLRMQGELRFSELTSKTPTP